MRRCGWCGSVTALGSAPARGHGSGRRRRRASRVARPRSSRKSADAWAALLPVEQIPAQGRALLLTVPGYDAIATACGCRFDPGAAQKVIDFFEQCLQHVEGQLAGQPFRLERWQQAVTANLLGWKRLD